MNFKNIGLALGLDRLGLIAGSKSAQAVVTENLSNVTFQDGGTGTGSFNYDPSTGVYSAMDVTINGQEFSGNPFTFTNADTVTSSPSFLDICQGTCPGGSKYFRLTFASPLTNTAATQKIITNSITQSI